MIAIARKITYKGRRAIQIALQLATVVKQFQLFSNVAEPRFDLAWKDRWLHLRDATATTGFDRHYVFHTAWAARIVAKIKPQQHVDVSSSLYFVTSVSAFVPTKFIDYRPADLQLSGLASNAGDLMALPFENASLPSISCMHVVEHIGLGRYGDPLDYDGDLKAIAELKRVVTIGGSLIFVVPISGKARIQFNAHRIYEYQQVLEMFPEFDLAEFALIPDDGSKEGLIRNADPMIADRQLYGCGCFHFVKRAAV
jgi:SAM-dependent methyltransferase